MPNRDILFYQLIAMAVVMYWHRETQILESETRQGIKWGTRGAVPPLTITILIVFLPSAAHSS